MNNLSSDCKSCSFKLLKCILVLKEDIRDVCLGPFLCLCAAARDSYNSGNGKVTFSDLWGDWEGAKKKKKKHQTNKWTIQTTFIYLRQSLLRKQITFCRLSGEMAFPFPSPALQGQQLGWVWGEAEAMKRKALTDPSSFLLIVHPALNKLKARSSSFHSLHVGDGAEPPIPGEYYPFRLVWPK